MSNELATVENTNNEMYPCTVDTSTVEGAITIANALNAAQSLNDYSEKTFTITDIVMAPGTRSVSGDMCDNTYLVLSDGTTLFSQSAGIARSARWLVKLLGDFIHEGVVASVVETPVRGGKSIKTLKLIAASA